MKFEEMRYAAQFIMFLLDELAHPKTFATCETRCRARRCARDCWQRTNVYAVKPALLLASSAPPQQARPVFDDLLCGATAPLLAKIRSAVRILRSLYSKINYYGLGYELSMLPGLCPIMGRQPS